MFGFGSVRLHQELGEARRKAKIMAEKKHKFLLSIRLTIEVETSKQEAVHILADKIRNIDSVEHIESLYIFE